MKPLTRLTRYARRKRPRLVSNQELEAIRLRERLPPLLQELRLSRDRGEGVMGLVFSFNRALQLHALLRSYFHYAANPAPLTVLYRSQGEGHARSYQELEREFAGLPVRFVDEEAQGFRESLLGLLEEAPAEKLFCLVDDICFTGAFDFNDFADLDPALFLFSLRHGRQLDFHYMGQVPMGLPPALSHRSVDPSFFVWRWGEGEYDWAYPLSVDGHLFNRLEFLAMVRLISFKAPNSLEHGLQVFLPFFAARLGVAYPHSRQVNLPINRVQKEFANIAGDITVDFLLQQWEEGRQIDWMKLRDYPNRGVHEDIQISFCPRQRQG